MLAEKALTYLNSGSFYRAYTYLHLQKGKDVPVAGVLATAQEVRLRLIDGHIHVNGIDIEQASNQSRCDVAKISIPSIALIRE